MNEDRILSNIRPKNMAGLTRKLKSRAETGKTECPVPGIIIKRFIDNTNISIDTIAVANPGRNIARPLPIQIAAGLSGVASRYSIFLSAFSFAITA
jgi:hypothetical protein